MLCTWHGYYRAKKHYIIVHSSDVFRNLRCIESTARAVCAFRCNVRLFGDYRPTLFSSHSLVLDKKKEKRGKIRNLFGVAYAVSRERTSIRRCHHVPLHDHLTHGTFRHVNLITSWGTHAGTRTPSDLPVQLIPAT